MLTLKLSTEKVNWTNKSNDVVASPVADARHKTHQMTKKIIAAEEMADSPRADKAC